MTLYVDQFWAIDPAAPPSSGTALEFERMTIDDVQSAGIIGAGNGDTLNGTAITGIYTNDVIRVQLSDGSFDQVTGNTLYLSDGSSYFTPTDGTILEDVTFISVDALGGANNFSASVLGPTCFVEGTLIETDQGPMPIECIEPGVVVPTLGGTPAAVQKVLKSHIDQTSMRRNEKLRPICISEEALGNNLPNRDLYVSRQHRILVRSKVAVRMYDVDEVLVPAHKLLLLPDVDVQAVTGDVTYFHLILDRHSVVFAEGTPTESLFLGSEAIRTMDAETRTELSTIFPSLDIEGWTDTPARVLAGGRRATKLVDRLLANNKPAIEVSL